MCCWHLILGFFLSSFVHDTWSREWNGMPWLSIYSVFGVSMLNSIFRISKKNDFAESFGIRNQFAVCGLWKVGNDMPTKTEKV